MNVPNDCRDFQTLCSNLLLNDPTVTHVTACRDTMPYGYGLRLGTALKRNTVVTEISLWQCTLLSGRNLQAQSFSSATNLLYWLRHSPALTTVKLYFFRCPRGRVYLDEFHLTLLEKILQALAARGRFPLRVWKSYLCTCPAPMLTPFLPSYHGLHTLRFQVHSSTRRADAQALADAIGRLPVLQTLVLIVSEQVAIFLQQLESSAVTDLTLFSDRGRHNAYTASDLVHLARVVQRSGATPLVRLALFGAYMDDERWNIMRAALQSNPSLTKLALQECTFAETAGVAFLNDLRSNDASRQHVRHLELTGCSFHEVRNAPPSLDRKVSRRLARVVCGGSLLERLTLDLSMIDHVPAFFRVWTRSASPIRLASLELKKCCEYSLSIMAEFIVQTVHLQHLILELPTIMREPEFNLPASLVASICRNGSLHTVEFRDERHHRRFRDERHHRRPPARLLRLVEAATTRNRRLPVLLTTKLETGNNSPKTIDTRCQWPTLGAAATMVIQMAPTTLLLGLVTAEDGLGPPAGCDGKRHFST